MTQKGKLLSSRRGFREDENLKSKISRELPIVQVDLLQKLLKLITKNNKLRNVLPAQTFH
jgi:hypothetical protein